MMGVSMDVTRVDVHYHRKMVVNQNRRTFSALPNRRLQAVATIAKEEKRVVPV